MLHLRGDGSDPSRLNGNACRVLELDNQVLVINGVLSTTGEQRQSDSPPTAALAAS